MNTDIRKKKRKPKKKDQSAFKIMVILGASLAGAGLLVLIPGLVLAGKPAGTGLMVFGMLLILVGAGVVVSALLPKARRPTLVFRDDVLQMKKGRYVVGQLPYANIATVELGRFTPNFSDVSFQALMVSLFKRRDGDTWWPVMYTEEDFDLLIKDEFNRPMMSMLNEIMHHVEQARYDRTDPRFRKSIQ
jgi:hypothetical protein